MEASNLKIVILPAGITLHRSLVSFLSRGSDPTNHIYAKLTKKLLISRIIIIPDLYSDTNLLSRLKY